MKFVSSSPHPPIEKSNGASNVLQILRIILSYNQLVLHIGDVTALKGYYTPSYRGFCIFDLLRLYFCPFSVFFGILSSLTLTCYKNMCITLL